MGFVAEGDALRVAAMFTTDTQFDVRTNLTVPVRC
jgi:hypothetical protein